VLTDNQYGFDLSKDNPFVIFRLLAEIAKDKVGIENVLDLSRGDPGYGFAPSVRGRQLYSFWIALDTHFNNFESHFKDRKHDSTEKVLSEIEAFAKQNYQPEVAKMMLKLFYEFIEKIEKTAKEQAGWDRFDVLFRMFKYSAGAGGYYHDPYGECIARIAVADYHTRKLGIPIHYNDLIFTSGASHAIGTFFKAFGEEGSGFLKKGDTALITSPVYFPYMGILQNRGINIETLSVDPESGQFSENAFEKVADINPKIIFLVDPDNPTGTSKNTESLKRLAKYAEEKDALILSDEVYFSFFEGKKSILNFAPKRTIRIDARSKIERATGCRFGEYLILPETNEYLSKKLKDFLPEGTDLKTYLHDAKAPGGVLGEFRHTTFVAGPAQLLGICHTVLGGSARDKYRGIVKKNMEAWYEGLGLEYKGNFYYSLLDMNSISSEAKKKVPAEKKFLDLAERGVVLIPSNLFFSERDRAAEDRSNYTRASLPNLTTEQVGKAAQIIKDYLVE
jgi:aspartate/methionine/tyrosine aminotransferase